MAKEKPLTDAERALIDHDAQINGERDPKNTRLSDGRTVAEAQAAAERVNNDWEAERVARKAEQARAREAAQTAPDAQQNITQQQAGGGKKTTAADK
jgi:hypothetical protein